MSRIRYRIGHLTLQPHRQLLAGESPVPIGRKALELLSVLAAADGDLVTKDELMAEVWPGVTIEENAVQVHIVALRKALGDSADRLQTVRSLGYRLVLDNGHDRDAAACPGSIAILPFANLTGDPGLDHLGEGVAEELINLLSHDPAWHVPSRTSSFAYKGHDSDIRQIARELGVGAVIEGSVRKAGMTIRFTAQLVDASTGFCLWSENYDRRVDDELALDDELANEIARTLHPIVAANGGSSPGLAERLAQPNPKPPPPERPGQGRAGG